MDTLSLALTVIECFLAVAVAVSCAIALSKLSKVLVFLPGGMRHMYFYLSGLVMVTESFVLQLSDMVSRNLHLIKKTILFSCMYLRFSFVSEYRTFSKNIALCVTRACTFVTGGFSRLKQPLLRYDSGGKSSSQSLALISQVILQ